MLTQASDELASYIGDVLGEHPDTTPAPRSALLTSGSEGCVTAAHETQAKTKEVGATAE